MCHEYTKSHQAYGIGNTSQLENASLALFKVDFLELFWLEKHSLSFTVGFLNLGRIAIRGQITHCCGDHLVLPDSTP